jgi:8-oxoguanine deaminase
VDTEENILKDSQRLIEKYHDAKAGAMTQIVLAPCSPFSVTSDLMKQSAKLAREYGVHLHTHLAETEDEEQFCMQMFGHRPVGYMQEVGWVGDDVWFAHAVWVNDEEIQVFAKHNCGVAHCPTSNMRLASGIAPVKEYRRAGVNVGLGVDGSASNDGSHLLAEVRNAMLVSRVKEGLTGYSLSGGRSERKLMTAREALHLGTRGGAAVLGAQRHRQSRSWQMRRLLCREFEPP